ncbi:sterol desaturase family protein [Paenibacillus sp. SYP-B4298]|uniref:sterol desaturase family protein n=1 Tax=Paenibacillus sp. SYP-B4298 TaxID=2996034 RepID=UPI0022DE76EF|nr:sterol desaturase family protein [Paenibacillus sp. SYP-B4298]
MIEFIVKMALYFLLWTLYSYMMHVIAHIPHKRNVLHKIHLAHHRYDYGDSKWPPWHDFFFWFGGWKESLDVWITFTLPILVLIWFDPVYGICLFGFHYIYEIFLSRNVLDHNPRLTGAYTNVIPVGQFHLKHHKFYKCNYSFFISIWDYLFRTNDSHVFKARRARKTERERAAAEEGVH